ncbi:MAG: DUF4097 domain-containing protein [Cyclobacteriaceae bacterium]|nr:hypothetical protein [Cyclobacteriaceae bacterium]MCH8516822.1 DUF4097 domain-containing protein [Cyclobacteriaceae bacterium]
MNLRPHLFLFLVSILTAFFEIKAQNPYELILGQRFEENQNKLNVESISGIWTIAARPLQDTHLRLLSNDPEALQYINQSYADEGDYHVFNLQLSHQEVWNFRDYLANKYFSKKKIESSWQLQLDEGLVSDANFHFGFGRATFDLSSLHFKNLKIKSASADLNISHRYPGHFDARGDSLHASVDIGDLNVQDLDGSRFSFYKLSSGIGKLSMDLRRIQHELDIYGTVGAGKLRVQLPASDYPIKIHVYDSPLCRTKVPKHLVEIEENVFTNFSSHDNAQNIVNLHLEVGMGTLELVASDYH